MNQTFARRSAGSRGYSISGDESSLTGSQLGHNHNEYVHVKVS